MLAMSVQLPSIAMCVQALGCYFHLAVAPCLCMSRRCKHLRFLTFLQGNVNTGCVLGYRPNKRQKQQATSRTLQSQRQAWMDRLTADAAQEVLTIIAL